MSIRTKEAQVPEEFPPARLFLDDIEEIVRIFRELVESPKFSERFTPEELEVKVTLSIGNKECDDVLDLPKISGRTKTSKLKITGRKGPADTSLIIHRFGSLWYSRGPTRENKWKAFHKLQPLFKARSTHWRNLVHSVPVWLLAVSGLIYTWLLVPTLRLLLKPHISTDWALAIFLGTILGLPFVFVFLIPLWGRIFVHTTVIMRHSWEPSAVRQELLHKMPLVVITALLTFLLTLLGFYLKHKFWP